MGTKRVCGVLHRLAFVTIIPGSIIIARDVAASCLWNYAQDGICHIDSWVTQFRQGGSYFMLGVGMYSILGVGNRGNLTGLGLV